MRSRTLCMRLSNLARLSLAAMRRASTRLFEQRGDAGKADLVGRPKCGGDELAFLTRDIEPLLEELLPAARARCDRIDARGRLARRKAELTRTRERVVERCEAPFLTDA